MLLRVCQVTSAEFGNNHNQTCRYSRYNSEIQTKATADCPISRVSPLTSASSSSSFALLFVLLGAPTSAALRHHLLLHHVDDLVWDSKILDGASSDVALRHPPELISILSEESGAVNESNVTLTFNKLVCYHIF